MDVKFLSNALQVVSFSLCPYSSLFPHPLYCSLVLRSTLFWDFTQRGRGLDGSVGIATRYGLGGPVNESRWGTRFSESVQTGPGAHPASYTMGNGSFPGLKRPGRGVDHPPSSCAEIKGRVELYICSPSRPSWPVLG